MPVCPYCSNGKIQGQPKPCYTCGGRRQVENPQRDPNNTYNMMACPTCGGSGNSGDYTYTECWNCHGVGRTPDPDPPPPPKPKPGPKETPAPPKKSEEPTGSQAAAGILSILGGFIIYFFLSENFTFREGWMPVALAIGSALIIAKFWLFLIKVAIAVVVALFAFPIVQTFAADLTEEGHMGVSLLIGGVAVWLWKLALLAAVGCVAFLFYVSAETDIPFDQLVETLWMTFYGT